MARRPNLSRPPVRRPRTPSKQEKRRPEAVNGLAAAIGAHSASEYREVAERYQIRSRTKRVVVAGSGALGVYVENAVPAYTGTLADECVASPVHSLEEAQAIAALPDILIDRDNLIYHCEKIIHEQKCGRVAMDPWFLAELVSLVEKNKKSMPA